MATVSCRDPGRAQGWSVRVEALTKRYEQDRAALDGVSIDFPAGQITSVLGGSGCGKTTLLRCIAGLEQPSSGRVLTDGCDITRADPADRQMAMVFQNYALYPAKTVADNIGFPLLMAGVPRARRRQEVADVAALLRLDGLLDRLPRELSGGQRQRVGIARAIVRRPAILLMDEPLSNLDTQLRTEMRAEIMALQRRIGATVLYVTHDQVEAMTMSDRMVVLRDGRVEQDGPPADVFATPSTAFVASFLGGMNLLEGRLLGVVPSVANGAGDVTVGVRPEHLAVGVPAPPGGIEFTATVGLTELLGTEKILHLEAGGCALRARVAANTSLGGVVTVSAPAEVLHHFDTRTGERRAPARR